MAFAYGGICSASRDAARTLVPTPPYSQQQGALRRSLRSSDQDEQRHHLSYCCALSLSSEPVAQQLEAQEVLVRMGSTAPGRQCGRPCPAGAPHETARRRCSAAGGSLSQCSCPGPPSCANRHGLSGNPTSSTWDLVCGCVYVMCSQWSAEGRPCKEDMHAYLRRAVRMSVAAVASSPEVGSSCRYKSLTRDPALPFPLFFVNTACMGA